MKTSRILAMNRYSPERREYFFRHGLNLVKDSCLRVNDEEHEFNGLFGVTGIPQRSL